MTARVAAADEGQDALADYVASIEAGDMDIYWGADIGAPGLGPEDFLRLLRTVVEAMPRLSLGTLDGFFARTAARATRGVGNRGRLVWRSECSRSVCPIRF